MQVWHELWPVQSSYFPIHMQMYLRDMLGQGEGAHPHVSVWPAYEWKQGVCAHSHNVTLKTSIAHCYNLTMFWWTSMWPGLIKILSVVAHNYFN